MTNRSIFNLLLIAFLCSGNQAMATEGLEPPGESHKVADFELKDLNNDIHTLSGYKGKVLLINFWASWCPPCIREFPSLERLSRAMDTSRFALLAINVGEGKGTVQRFQRLQDAGIKMLMDKNGVAAGSWGVNVYPSSFIVDTSGVIRESFIGETDWDDEEKHASIKALFSVNTDK